MQFSPSTPLCTHRPQAVTELLGYLASEKSKGAEILPEDVADLREAGQSVLQGIDEFLKLAPREDVATVERSTIEAAATSRRSGGVPFAAESSAMGTRGLRGAVVGEGALTGGAWMDGR